MSKVAIRIPDLHACSIKDLEFAKGMIEKEIERQEGKEFEKPPKICSCGCLDLDHEISQVYGLYHCLNCKKSCMSSDFKKLPKDKLPEYRKKFKELKAKGSLA